MSRQSVLCGSQNIVLNGKVLPTVASIFHVCYKYSIFIPQEFEAILYCSMFLWYDFYTKQHL